MVRRLFLATCVAVLLSASAAFAAPVSWERIDVTLHTEGTNGALLISGMLPEKTPLPAKASLAVAEGSSVQWLGEILGGDASSDPELKYTKVTKGGLDIYEFTLTKARIAQIELSVENALTFDGQNYGAAVQWTPDQKVGEVRLAVRVPEGTKIPDTDPDAMLLPGDPGFQFFTKTFKDVPANAPLKLDLTYPAAPVSPVAAGAAAQSGSSNTAQMIIFGVLILVFVGGGLAVRSRMKPSSRATSGASPVGDESGFAFASDDARPVTVARVDASVVDEAEPSVIQPATGKRGAVTAGVIIALVVLVGVVAIQTSKPQQVGEAITVTFAQGDACTSAVIPVTAPASAKPAATAETLFGALKTAGNVIHATYDPGTSSITVGFCDSQNTEAAIKATLATTGMVTQ